MSRTKTFSPTDALDKAIVLFRLRGFNNTSMQTIANHLGISRSSVYTTFGSRHTLFVAALRQYGPTCRLPGLRELRVSPTPRTALIRVFELAIAAADGRLTYDRCLLINSAIELRDPSSEIAQILQAAFLDLESSFRQAIERAQADHEIADSVVPLQTARSLLTLFLGLQVLLRSGAINAPLAVLQHVRLLLPTRGA